MPDPIPARRHTPDSESAPTLDAALALWEALSEAERSNLFRELWLAVQAAQDNGDSAPIREFAERLQVSVRIERAQPGVHALFRASLPQGPAADPELLTSALIQFPRSAQEPTS